MRGWRVDTLSSNYTTRNLSEDLIKLKCVLLVCFDFILSIYATLRVICVHWVLYDISSIQMSKYDLLLLYHVANIVAFRM